MENIFRYFVVGDQQPSGNASDEVSDFLSSEAVANVAVEWRNHCVS